MKVAPKYTLSPLWSNLAPRSKLALYSVLHRDALDRFLKLRLRYEWESQPLTWSKVALQCCGNSTVGST